jgi:hypothetical protein
MTCIIQHNLMTDLQDQVEAGPVAVSAFNAVARLDELVVDSGARRRASGGLPANPSAALAQESAR